MKKKPNLEMFHFEFNVRCADNGMVIEYPNLVHGDEISNPYTLMKTEVTTTKQELLDIISAQLDKIYE
jgi:hypothetical protein